MISFVVPGHPQGKGRPRIGKVGQHARMFTPSKTVAYEGLIAHAAHASMRGLPLFECACSVTLRISCQVPASWSKKKQAQALAGEIRPTTKPDIDNVEKAVFDGLNGVVWKDDVQVVEVHKDKRYASVPGLEVCVVPIGVLAPVRVNQHHELMDSF